MKTEYEDLVLKKNELTKRFELIVNGHLAYIDYKESSSDIYLIHTEVQAVLAGMGVGQALVEKALDYVNNSSKQLMPYCPYVFAYIQKHPTWKLIVDPKFPKYEEL